MTSTAPVEIQFDPNQDFQLDAVKAVVDLFTGQQLATSQFEAPTLDGGQGALQSDLGFGNNVMVAEEQVRANLDLIQDANNIPDTHRGLAKVDADSLASWDFSVEMETGTGKTYVYLRTALELNKEYGFTKFVIVVPTVAIREGVQQNLNLLKGHFASLYDGTTYGVVTYDSKDPSRLRGFATSNQLQFLVINIDAFNKDTNLIYRATDSMMGSKPIDFITGCNPIVILDEPQNMESEKASEAIASLNPAVTLRYSATHKNRYHQLYRLTPVDAYNLGLVKRISVWSVTEELNGNKPYIRVLSITPTKTNVTAQLEVNKFTDGVPKRAKIKVTGGAKPTDLAAVTDNPNYDGWVVEDINAADGYVEFGNGEIVEFGDVTGASRDQLQRAQIRAAIAEHLDRELDIHRRNDVPETKVLTLFFIDKVANYAPEDGKFRLWFQAEYEAARAKPKYKNLNLPEASLVHNGYFAAAKGVAKDTSGKTTADDEAYQLIMKDKQRLLSTAEPLRFIFSHSALREGWDNPNVFVICTLNESVSTDRKRQEIGRGLRLPVTTTGERCTDPKVAKLTVVANEAYEEFAATLQREIEDETGTKFAKGNISDARAKRVKVRINQDAWNRSEFKELWERIKARTTYSVNYDTADLIAAATKRLSALPPLTGAKIRTKRVDLSFTDKGIDTGDVLAEKAAVTVEMSYPIPDLLGNLSRLVPVSRSTIANILIDSGRLGEVKINPQQFIEQAREAIDGAHAALLTDGITYKPRGEGDDEFYEMRLFHDGAEDFDKWEREELEANTVAVDKSLFTHVVYDSDLERDIAKALDAHEDVELFVKLPLWFKVDTPIGPYNPDWAYTKRNEEGTADLYLVRESKPTTDLDRLRPTEKMKVKFGGHHFDALKVNSPDLSFAVIDTADEV